MNEKEQSVADWYANHPISAPHILTKLKDLRGSLTGLQPQDLYPFDQDHYDGLNANARLAANARMKPGDQILDVCAGLCGPARWFASERNVDVTGLDISPDRVSGAKTLNELVGLQGNVHPVQGSAMDLPFEIESFDAAVSQEAFLHLPNKLNALLEVFRVLRPSGRFAFTDWVMHVDLPENELEQYKKNLACQSLCSIPEYVVLLEKTGFAVIEAIDMTDLWGEILACRLQMYQSLEAEAGRAGNPYLGEAFLNMYAKFTQDVQQRRIGGVCLTAEKPT